MSRLLRHLLPRGRAGRLLRLTVALATLISVAMPAAAAPTGIPLERPLASAAPAVLPSAASAPMAGAQASAAQAGQAACQRSITAEVVALDQPIVYNRLGTINPVGMIFALRRDVVEKTAGGPGLTEAQGGVLAPGRVQLREDRRPRPLTLRMNVGDCLQISFQNLIDPNPLPVLQDERPATRSVGVTVNGLELVSGITDEGQNVGRNPNSLVAPGGRATYRFYGGREGTNLLYSAADTTGGEAFTGTLAFGLFGAVNVEPRGAEWYRSQVTRQEMDWATTGTTPDGHPVLNYDAVYPSGHRYAGLPILKILNGNQVVHSDLTAIITGPGRGPFAAGTYRSNPSYPNRDRPFREFTTIYHDEIFTNQAFAIFEDPRFEFTLHSVRDSFAINYGTGGVGAEIVANRLGVGPMGDCPECKFEEFFLTSWAVGDPAMVVDVPANTDLNGDGQPDPGRKATRAYYPDDPSNVYHSYLNDRVKIRNLSVGKEHHIFHLHAHQWLMTPDDDNSSYLDSQAIGPGVSYTYEITYNGSGNRNKTPGDSIFHCHFYPHFAQGMWALWRVHDVFEAGTLMDGAGRPASGSRALPDGEIAAGTPVPGLVPMPTMPMAPLPGAQVQIVDGQLQVTPLAGAQLGNPGYPFFIAGAAGHRPPTPPLDMTDPQDPTGATIYDGGLPRHVITGGEVHSVVTPLDFSKELLKASARYYPETGTPEELAAMAFHERRWQPTYTPEGSPGQFETNGLPRTPGAPYAEPCRNDDGTRLTAGQYNADNPRIYRAADIQFDMKINKVGWHVPQARIITLWGDVQATLDATRAPQPFVMRANSGDCITYYHTNLVPGVYEQDAFQVRTPTDVIGQHIHLVKFDVTSADGSGNGFNYEDGTFSPDEVRERIRAIRANNGCLGAESGDPRDGSQSCPVPKAHPFFGAGPNGKWLGARTTIQRWYADPVVNNQGVDRTLGNVYTHDHYGPSTHQQTGLYATLLLEPSSSTWRHPETGEIYGNRRVAGTTGLSVADGGPTNWHADILAGPNGQDSFREFYLEFQDFQLAYEAGRGLDATGKPIPDPMGAISPPGVVEAGLPKLFAKPSRCPSGSPFLPNGCPEAISAADVGTYSVNYRNEPLAFRVRDPKTSAQATGFAGDLAYAFSSNVKRADARLNSQPTYYPPLTADVGRLDPYTPMLRVYDNDKVRVRIQVGATEEGHNATIQGVKWLQEYASPNSGWRNSQMLGISEQFNLDVPVVLSRTMRGEVADHLYTTSASSDGLWNGDWGLMRAYGELRKDLKPLPNNPITETGLTIDNGSRFKDMCPVEAPVRRFDVTAVTAKDALPGGTLVYNPRSANGGPLNDPTAILYVRTEDLDSAGKLRAGLPIEPLILRAAAGDCIEVNLRNRLPKQLLDLPGGNAMPPILDGFNGNDVRPSSDVGLHPQLVAYDVTRADGSNVGRNKVQTTPPLAASPKQYRWYAGDVKLVAGNLVATPVEFGAINLISPDRIKHSSKGAIGALIIEPQGSMWAEDPGTRASATVTKSDGTRFRDFVLLFQDDLNLRFGNGSALPLVGGESDSEDSGAAAFNYRTEPLWFRKGIDPTAAEEVVRTFDFSDALSNSLIGGDPVTPVFTAVAGTPVRLRVLKPGGHTRNHVFALDGHNWQREPHVDNSARIGDNALSEWRGAQEGHGPTDHWDFVLERGAGGAFAVPGDYLFRDMQPSRFYQGLWGILRVTPP